MKGGPAEDGFINGGPVEEGANDQHKSNAFLRRRVYESPGKDHKD